MTKTTLILIAFIMLVGWGLTVRSCIAERHKKQQVIALPIQNPNDSTSHYRDLYNRDHAEHQQAIADIKTLKAYYPHIIDSVCKSLDIKSNALQSLAAIGMHSDNTVQILIDTVYVDSSHKQALRLKYDDRWITLRGTISDNPEIHYTTYDSLIITSYRKKTGWFKHAVYVDAYSLNPHSRIDGVTGIKVDQVIDKRFGIGPYIGYGYDGQRFRPSIGLSVNYSLIKF
jgi:hypothetical protein